VRLAIAWEPLNGSTTNGELAEGLGDNLSPHIARAGGEEWEGWRGILRKEARAGHEPLMEAFEGSEAAARGRLGLSSINSTSYRRLPGRDRKLPPEVAMSGSRQSPRPSR
jgi:hypothetical protein